MIIVLGFIKVAPGEADRLSSAMATIMAETEKEDGCVRYVFSRTVGDPDQIVISELWRDQAALDAHFAMPHMAAFNAALADAKLLDVTVKQYDGENVRTIMGHD
jgi:quinol monooxygenase YgiN